MKRFALLLLITGLIVGVFFAIQKTNFLEQNESKKNDFRKIKAVSLLKNSKPVFGYRFIIYGDFNGDHKVDTLCEKYMDSTLKFEMPKYYQNPDSNFEYDDVIFLSEYFNNKSFLEWEKHKIQLSGGQLGFHYIENCGDINIDGKDEILLVQQWPDFSNLNTAFFYTYSKGVWSKIYSTPVWEWQFPPTPFSSMLPSMFGDFNYVTNHDNSVNQVFEKELKEYNFIKYYPDQSIEFSCRNSILELNNENFQMEFDTIGQQEFVKKHFDRVYLNDSIYLRAKENPSIHYKVKEKRLNHSESILLFNIDDPAEMVTTRIYINHPQSPFRKSMK